MRNINYKRIKDKKDREKDRVFQVLKYICFVGIGIVLLEFLYLGFLMLKGNKEINIDLAQKIVSTDDGYIVLGSSNFDKSTIHEKSDQEEGKFSLYDNNDKLLDEFKYDKYYKSVFYDAARIADGYIVVGSVQKTKKQNEKGVKDALIVKYDFDGNVVWDTTYSELEYSSFRSLLVDGESIIVVGSSIYEGDVADEEDKGGAIVVKYDLSGNVIQSNHFGDNRSGAFNDLIKIGDMYYAVGSDTSNKAFLVGIDFNLKKKIEKNYEDTNSLGFTSIVNANDHLYVVCSKTKEEDKKIKELATIVQYDYSGKKINEVIYDKEDYSIWNEIIVYNDELYLTGESAIKKGKKGSIFVDYLYKGIVSKYSYDLKQIWISEYEYENNDYYKSIMIKNNKLYVVGFTNSKNKELKSDKYNYVTLLNQYDLEGKLQ